MRINIFSRRSSWALPYALFLGMFVALPLVLIVIFAFTDNQGEFSLLNFEKFITQPEAVNTFV